MVTTMTKHWHLDDIDWDRIEPGLVDAELLATVKTAALVEGNSQDYVRYLHNVFSDDLLFLLNNDADLIVARMSRGGFTQVTRYEVASSATLSLIHISEPTSRTPS